MYLIVLRPEKKNEKTVDEKIRETVNAVLKENLLEETKQKGIGKFELNNEYIKIAKSQFKGCPAHKKKL